MVISASEMTRASLGSVSARPVTIRLHKAAGRWTVTAYEAPKPGR
jgi:hypothetical protein